MGVNIYNNKVVTMSKDIKCPFCQQELEQITTSNPLGLGRIEMAVCKKCMDKGVLHIMPIWDWQELIRTHKALEWARHFLKEIRLRYLFEKDEPSRQNKWWDTALYMYNLAEDFFDDYDKTNETKGGDNE